MAKTGDSIPETGAEGVLLGLGAVGVEYLFANAGTDFPPIIEALAKLPAAEMPQPVTVPHETASVAMAHGYWLATGRMQAVMVHVNVGLANATMGLINAASDNVPVLMMSGRTPLTETGRLGHRITPIQYGQEMYDQASLVRDTVKYTYEMRYPEQGAELVARASAVACDAPAGPVYLSLPREPLGEAMPDHGRRPAQATAPAAPAHPDPGAVAQAAAWLAGAAAPVILVNRGDVAGDLSAALSDLAGRHGIAVAEPFSVRNVMASADPSFIGHDPKAAMEGADVVLALDIDIPWIEAAHGPAEGVRVIHAGPDPRFTRMPVRGYRTDLAVTADPLAFVRALAAAMPAPDARAEARRAAVVSRAEGRRARAVEAAQAGEGAMSAEWMSRCLGEAMGNDSVVYSELGVLPGPMDLAGPNRVFSNVHAGGLGWAMPAALGGQLADRSRPAVACMGDGSYIFANPVACHQIAEALELPILTIVKNNGMWNAVRRSVVAGYPEGAAARSNAMPLTSLQPAPDYCQIAAASRAHVERVETGADLPAALARAFEVIRTERRQAMLDLRVAVSDRH